MRRLLVALALLLPAEFADAAEECDKCCRLENAMAEVLIEQRDANGRCLDGDEKQCTRAVKLAAKYYVLSLEKETTCGSG